MKLISILFLFMWSASTLAGASVQQVVIYGNTTKCSGQLRVTSNANGDQTITPGRVTLGTKAECAGTTGSYTDEDSQATGANTTWTLETNELHTFNAPPPAQTFSCDLEAISRGGNGSNLQDCGDGLNFRPCYSGGGNATVSNDNAEATATLNCVNC